MSAININGVKVSACHGVLESEKTTPQPFIFDIAIESDISVAAISDEVKDTVDYAEVCTIITEYCKKNSFNLIERLANGAAEAVIKKFPAANAVEVTVHKPHAPIPHPFDDVSVTARVERNEVVLSLGSSEGEKEESLQFAVDRLAKTEGIEVISVSSFIQSSPYGGVAKNIFLNGAVLINTILSPRRLLNIIHEIEAEGGRVRTKRWADRTLDIDIVFFGNKMVQENGLCIPHPDYINRQFVLIPLKQIVPNFVCPLTHKRVIDL
ncbi:MAG: 2-amino-4-hydroxy-6-hydroxymethyldihydropteridine diphosphokinase [Candidatus Coproplasma sp.]